MKFKNKDKNVLSSGPPPGNKGLRIAFKKLHDNLLPELKKRLRQLV